MSDILKQFSRAQEGLVTQQSDFSLKAIKEMIEENSIDIAPHYQRRDRWSAEKQSALIESFLLNVPVPPVYLSEDDYGNYSVIDGKQRLTTIYDFLNDKFQLKELARFTALNGKNFSKLPAQLQNVLKIRPFIRVITLLQQSDPELKYEVFLRLNTGGEKLKAQEIRNVAYSGPFNDLLFDLSSNEFLRKQLKIKNKKSTPYRNMDDVEMVLRFFAIRGRWEHFGQKLAQGMDGFMAENRYEYQPGFRGDFLRAITTCKDLWGDRAFQKPLNENGWREQFIAPLYDAQMIAVSTLSDIEIDSLKRSPQEVVEATRTLFQQDQEFIKSVTQATSDSSQIRTRIGTLIGKLKELV